MTVRNLTPSPLPDFAMAPATKTATKMGAMAFNAPTKTVPNRATKLHSGSVRPKTIPTTMPINIFTTSEVLVQNFINDFMTFNNLGAKLPLSKILLTDKAHIISSEKSIIPTFAGTIIKTEIK